MSYKTSFVAAVVLFAAVAAAEVPLWSTEHYVCDVAGDVAEVTIEIRNTPGVLLKSETQKCSASPCTVATYIFYINTGGYEIKCLYRLEPSGGLDEIELYAGRVYASVFLPSHSVAGGECQVQQEGGVAINAYVIELPPSSRRMVFRDGFEAGSPASWLAVE